MLNALGIPGPILAALCLVELALVAWQLYRHRPLLTDWWRQR